MTEEKIRKSGIINYEGFDFEWEAVIENGSVRITNCEPVEYDDEIEELLECGEIQCDNVAQKVLSRHFSL